MINAIRFRIAFILLASVVALSPLPFGSVDDPTIAFWVVPLAIASALHLPTRLTPSHRAVFLVLAVIVGAWGVVFHEQSSATPWFSRALLDPVWGQASSLLDRDLSPGVSVVRNQPFYAAGNQMLAFLAFLGGFLAGERRSGARRLLRIVAWSGALYACYAILSFIWDPSTVLWREKIAYKSVLTGTFINRNTAATYFGSCAILWLLLFFKAVSRRFRSMTKPESILSFVRSLNRRTTFYLCMSGVLLCTTFMTGSRAGSLLTLLICGTIAFLNLRGILGRGWQSVSILGLVAVAGLVFLFAAGSGVDARFSTESLASEARFPVYGAVLKMIADHPLLGTGLGTFAWMFPSYRPDSISVWGVWDRAHSTPLEIIAEQGGAYALLLFCSLAAALVVLIRGVRHRRSGRIYPAAGLSLLVLSCAHSSIDFSLQIPGLTIVIFAVVGAGIAQSEGSRVAKVPRHGHVYLTSTKRVS